MKNNYIFTKPLLIILFVIYIPFGFASSDFKNFLYPPTEFQTTLHHWVKKGLGIENFDSWLFKPGALYGVLDIWWQTKNNYTRNFPHEGVDFYFYKDKNSDTILHVKEGTPIPLIESGKLVAVFNDFIGQTFLFSTDKFTNYMEQPYQFYIMYSHVKPIDSVTIKIGDSYNSGDKIFSFNNQIKNFAPPHLHLTAFWANSHFNYKNLSWDILNNSPDVIFVNPFVTQPKSEILGKVKKIQP